MDGEQRREIIKNLLYETQEPLSGAFLAKKLGISRQVIVQDIALLRATNKNILSTNKGYVVYGNAQEKISCKRIIAVKHDDREMREELYAIVDAGAKVLDVVIEHEVYGQITVDLLISSRKDVDEFMAKILLDKAKPLKELTGDIHYHTIEAATKENLDAAEKKLKENGFLLL